ncbi:F-box protein CPR30 [Forsythia ovata]|uniref:F-box protein CPR30 n=1 Tax=Forsythia ovata TaxID=205694 RepID=A0ABD1WJ74_9LAMI
MDNYGHISQDMIIEILSRLPEKSLQRCKCVCNSWRSIITSRSFIYEHFNMALADIKNAHLLISLYDRDTQEDVFYLFTNDELKAPTNLRIRTNRHRYLNIMGPCHGLFCLYDSEKLCLWNPATREIKDIPESPIPLPSKLDCMCEVLFGFGFDSKTIDYKVVKLLRKDCVDQHNNYSVEVYTLSTNSWRIIDVVVPAYIICYLYTYDISAYMNGTYYWYAEMVIVCFDMSNEQFGMIRLPKIDFPLVEENYRSGNFISSSRFTECNGSLAVIFYLRNGSNIWSELWTMNGHGMAVTWTKQFSVGWLEGQWMPCPIGTFKNNKVLFVSMDSKCAITPYDHETRSLQIPLPVDSDIKIKCRGWNTIAVLYTESLISIRDV